MRAPARASTTTVAAELAGAEDAVLRALRSTSTATSSCAATCSRSTATPDDVQAGGDRRRRARRTWSRRGTRSPPATIEAVAGALDAARVAGGRSSRTSSGATAAQGRAEDRQPEALRRRDPQQHDHVRHRPGRHRQDVPGGRDGRRRALAREVNRIILTRPAVEAGERLGFLPGDLMAKVDPYLRPLFDALYDMLDPERCQRHLERGVIEVAPLAFMRGRTLNDSFVILDEAQNTTPEQMKMFLTRLGFGSRMVVTGDITQIDLPRDQRSGLIVVGEILEGVEGIEFVRFGGEDVVRHKLVQRIVAAYDEHAERQAPELGPRSAGDPVADSRSRSSRRLPGGRCAGAVGGGARAAAGVEDGHVAVEFVGAERIRELNREHRGKDAPTDVLSFPVDGDGPDAGPRELGDVVICPEHTADSRGGRPRRAAPRAAWTTRPTTARCSRCRRRSCAG